MTGAITFGLATETVIHEGECQTSDGSNTAVWSIVEYLQEDGAPTRGLRGRITSYDREFVESIQSTLEDKGLWPVAFACWDIDKP